jgi:aspartate racemase
MMPRSPIPWLHIAEVVADEATHQGFSKLGILGTKFLMEGKVYPQILSQRGIGIVVPTLEHRDRINKLILEELVQGILKDSTREYFKSLVAELAEQGCDAIVMACTEIPLILRPDDVETPLLDSTGLLAAAALKEALGPEGI